MAVARLDNRAARKLFLQRHALLEPPSGAANGDALAELITRLGFVQLDSINTVARAHDMILYSRRPRYRPSALKSLYERDQRLFEHWTHDAAVVPMAFYPHWHLRFQRDAAVLRQRYRNWHRDGYEAKFQHVLDHIRDHGPVSSSDVGRDEKKGTGGWWDWHPSKTALEYLWRSGALAVVGRRGFQKQYDLTERVIDQQLLPGEQSPDPQESIDWLCDNALDRLGFATSGELAAFWATATPAECAAWCKRAQADGRIEAVDIELADGRCRRVFARPEALDTVADLPDPPGRMRVLSPFDPALRDRKRAEGLFGFHYRIEVFTPAPKRRYGYYVFPLMEKARLIGRIDMKAQRQTGVLQVTAVWPEPAVRWSSARQSRLEAELDRVARFAGLDRVAFAQGWLREPQ
ncbi:crosslink repair DNA glycosylase YcaQ family protein [Phaeobacter sp.]|uniref:winged helix-turn-helix domain-containing protein n=1 Tax=Phaeobacter sp. TaxID=1902409 RepID=UPI0025D00A56|nr:crosslink repair DNA glycosylase YcaQ family protein [Phaeobacter sp.]